MNSSEPSVYVAEEVVDRCAAVVKKGTDQMKEMLIEVERMTEETKQTKEETQKALNQVSGGFQQPVPAPVKIEEAKSLRERLFTRSSKLDPRHVTFTKAEARECLAMGNLTPEMVEVAEVGLTALGLEAALSRKLVITPDKPRFTPWQMVGIAALGVGSAAALAVGAKAAHSKWSAKKDALLLSDASIELETKV